MIASFTTSAPVPRILVARCSRSAGTPSNSCIDSTTPWPPRSVDQIGEVPRATRCRCTPRRASGRRRADVSALPLSPSNQPPSHFGRQVKITGSRRPARAPAALGSRTESTRSSTRSACVTRSRRSRSSAIVAAVTVTQSFAAAHKNKNASSGWLKRRLGRVAGGVQVYSGYAPSDGCEYHHQYAYTAGLAGMWPAKGTVNENRPRIVRHEQYQGQFGAVNRPNRAGGSGRSGGPGRG